MLMNFKKLSNLHHIIKRQIRQLSHHSDLQHFEHIDPADWFDEQKGAFRALHTFNRLRIPWILAHFIKNAPANTSQYPMDGKCLLDVGCGAGILSTSLARLGAQVNGIDATENAIMLSQKLKNTMPIDYQSKINFTLTTVEELAMDTANIEKFDGIIASEVVEHVDDLPSFIKNCCKLAKPNAPLFFTTINRTIFSRIFALTAAEDILRILPKGLHHYEKFVQPSELRKLLVDEQCRVGPVLGLTYNPFLKRWDWSNFTQINYALVSYTRNRHE